ncbi:MAG: 4-hydroxy-tetrahydrodipicolinate synthase [Helicobacteraceae bacterium]|jgi:4-hydroxy-tetrahydrodipicolinate synthase|nr:4-hydroxy-tetrahydrodipicolinate synthase [Helicobacteraceae bacterium]
MLKGAFTALVTPFSGGKVDFTQYERLIKRQIANGINGVVPVGTTGESATLTHEEHRECIEAAIAACKGTETTILAGAGSNSTHEAIGLAKFAQKAGADAILCVTPYYNKPTQEGLYQHYKAIASAIEIGVVLYNVPGRTGCDLLPQTIARLFDDCKNIVAVKEATGNVERSVAIHSLREEIKIFSGDDAVNYPIVACGGQGAISVASNLLPDRVSTCVNGALLGDYENARRLNDELYPINKALFLESNPIPIKAAMYLTGLLPSLEYRLPLVAPSKATMTELENVLKNYEVKGF